MMIKIETNVFKSLCANIYETYTWKLNITENIKSTLFIIMNFV